MNWPGIVFANEKSLNPLFDCKFCLFTYSIVLFQLPFDVYVVFADLYLYPLSTNCLIYTIFFLFPFLNLLYFTINVRISMRSESILDSIAFIGRLLSWHCIHPSFCLR